MEHGRFLAAEAVPVRGGLRLPFEGNEAKEERAQVTVCHCLVSPRSLVDSVDLFDWKAVSTFVSFRWR